METHERTDHIQASTMRWSAWTCIIGLGLLSCSRSRPDHDAVTPVGQQSSAAAPTNQTHPDIELPSKVFRDMQDGSLRVDGHWVLKTSDPPLRPDDLPFAAQPLNSTMIACSAQARSCIEYRATIIGDLLLPSEPMTYTLSLGIPRGLSRHGWHRQWSNASSGLTCEARTSRWSNGDSPVRVVVVCSSDGFSNRARPPSVVSVLANTACSRRRPGDHVAAAAEAER